MLSGFVLDKEDCSITRSDLYYKELFQRCGLHLYQAKVLFTYPQCLTKYIVLKQAQKGKKEIKEFVIKSLKPRMLTLTFSLSTLLLHFSSLSMTTNGPFLLLFVHWFLTSAPTSLRIHHMKTNTKLGIMKN